MPGERLNVRFLTYRAISGNSMRWIARFLIRPAPLQIGPPEPQKRAGQGSHQHEKHQELGVVGEVSETHVEQVQTHDQGDAPHTEEEAGAPPAAVWSQQTGPVCESNRSASEDDDDGRARSLVHQRSLYLRVAASPPCQCTRYG